MANKLAYYFTLAIFVTMLASMFFVVLYAPSQQASATPTPSAAPAAPVFRGLGPGPARVLELGSQYIVQCKGVSPEFVKLVESVPGVQTAFRPSSDTMVVVANASAADAANATGGKLIASAVAAVLEGACEESPRVLRAALLEFTSPVKLSSSSDSEVKAERTLFPREITGYGLRTAGVAGLVSYVDGPTADKNASITAVVSLVARGEQIEQLIAEQALVVPLPPASLAANASEALNASAGLNATASSNESTGAASNATSNSSTTQ